VGDRADDVQLRTPTIVKALRGLIETTNSQVYSRGPKNEARQRYTCVFVAAGLVVSWDFILRLIHAIDGDLDQPAGQSTPVRSWNYPQVLCDLTSSLA